MMRLRPTALRGRLWSGTGAAVVSRFGRRATPARNASRSNRRLCTRCSSPTVLAVITPPGTEPVVELSDGDVTTTVPTAALGPSFVAVQNEGWQVHVFAVSPGTRHASAKAVADGKVVSTSNDVFAPTS